MQREKLILEYDGKVNESIIKQINFLIKTPISTVVCDRSFGMDMSYIDKPLHIAETLFAAELSEKLEKYIPSVELKKVIFNRNEIDGQLFIRMVIA